MRKVSGLLSDAIQSKEILRAAKAMRILRNWEEIVGLNLASKCSPDRYDKGTVFIAVKGSAWAQELRLKKDELTKRLCALAGDETLFIDLKFGVRPPVPIEPTVPQKPPRPLDIRPFEEVIESIRKRALENSNPEKGDSFGEMS